MIRAVCIGTGGHARVLIEAARMSGTVEICAVVTLDQTVWGAQLLSVPIVGGDDRLPDLRADRIDHFINGVGGVRDNSVRARVFQEAKRAGFVGLTIIHPQASLSHTAILGEGTVMLAGAVVNANAAVGANVILGSGSVVEHDCVIEDHVHIAPGALLGGGVRVRAFAHIGIGATVIQGTTIGERTVLGAGAVAIRDIPAGSRAIGVPAEFTAFADKSEK